MNAVKTLANGKIPRELPLTTETAFKEFLRVFGLMERIMQAHFARFGISGSQWGVLRVLDRARKAAQPGLRITDLSDQLLIRPPSVTGAIDRLERAGLVERHSTPLDQRVKQVSLTSKGSELVDRALEAHQRQISTVLGGLNTKEQAELGRLLSQLGHHLLGLLARGNTVDAV
jgi:DNA-binding MarR family transcriptional regulator